MWAADGLMRDVCLPKFLKITNETGAGIRAGTLSNDKDAKCNVNYTMEMMQTVRKGKFLYEASLKQVDALMPDDNKDEYKAGLAASKHAAGEDSSRSFAIVLNVHSCILACGQASFVFIFYSHRA
ncbi:general odorant-binding protein 19a-like [Stomoxys calcitrans]|uniref:general odorant-binding protein 19a-like n=1 Tax=Stomoxys calcitrans TaxID=35570 RepID=UPI0027E3629A|nr:general odorant-binding protein 19a-like [Stomoxys calcitrans]